MSFIVLRALDKLEKLGQEVVSKGLAVAGLSEQQIQTLFDFVVLAFVMELYEQKDY